MSTRIILIPDFSLVSPSSPSYSILPNFLQRGTKPRIRPTFHSIPRNQDSTRLFLSLSVWKGTRFSRIPDASSVVLWIKEKGRGRERRCNYLFQIFEIFAGGLLLVVRELLEKWGWWWTIRRGNVSFSLCVMLSRDCGFTFSKNFLLVHRIIILFRF